MDSFAKVANILAYTHQKDPDKSKNILDEFLTSRFEKHGCRTRSSTRRVRRQIFGLLLEHACKHTTALIRFLNKYYWSNAIMFGDRGVVMGEPTFWRLCQNGRSVCVVYLIKHTRLAQRFHVAAFYHACMYGRTDIARAILRKYPQVRFQGTQNLRNIAGFGHLDTLKFLDRHKIIKINSDTHITTFLLMIKDACKGGHKDVAEWLLETKKIREKLTEDEMFHCLSCACKSGNYKLIKLFIDYMNCCGPALSRFNRGEILRYMARRNDQHCFLSLYRDCFNECIKQIHDVHERNWCKINLDISILAHTCCNANNKQFAEFQLQCRLFYERLDTLYRYHDAEIVNDLLGPAYDHGCFEMIQWLYDRLQLSKHINKVNKTNLILKISDIDDEEKRQTIYGWTINAFKIQRKGLDTTKLLLGISRKCGISNFKTAKWMIETFVIQLSDFRKYENDVMWVACGRPHNMEFVQWIVEHIRFTWSDVVLGSSIQKPWLDYCVSKQCWDVLEYLIRRFDICHKDFTLGENAELTSNIPQELHILLSLNSIVR